MLFRGAGYCHALRLSKENLYFLQCQWAGGRDASQCLPDSQLSGSSLAQVVAPSHRVSSVKGPLASGSV